MSISIEGISVLAAVQLPVYVIWLSFFEPDIFIQTPNDWHLEL